MEKVSILGMGYVGFPLACAVAKAGKYEVIGIDISEEKVKKINNGISPVRDKQAEKDIREVSIKASSNIEEIKDSDIIILAVPTPVTKNKHPDLSFVKNATKSILPYVKDNQLIILESTVSPGVCEEEILPILNTTGKDFCLIHCPERIDPGNPEYNVYNIPRNIGGTSKEGTKRAADFYRTFIKADVNEMSCLKAAEATKILENTFRDINIAYINEVAKSFDIMGLDILEVIKGASSKPFGFMPHYPGCGVGGHCIPVDPYYLIEKASDSGFDHVFLKYARKINESMPEYTVEKLVKGLNQIEKPVKNTKIGLLGLSYKPNVADLRESPALKIKVLLEELQADLMICEPNIEGYAELNQILDEC